jgi:ABC-type transport system involved in cytochrome c biogenesis permease subunit
MDTPLGYATLALYAVSFVLYVWHLYSNKRVMGLIAAGCLAAGLVLHYFTLLERSRIVHAVPYDDLYGSMSLFAWLLAFTYLALETYHRDRSVGAFVVPFVILWMVIAMAVAPGVTPHPAPARGPLFALHVTLNVLAYSAFALSFVLSLIYLLQNRILRARRPGRIFWRFPALEVLDRITRSSVLVGVISLVGGITMGFIWEHRLSGRYWSADPKILVTLVVLLAYGGYLWLSRTAAWRGARAAVLCACNFLVVIFSYTIVNLYLTSFHRYF